MGYGFGVFAKLEAWLEGAPVAKRALPWVSGALVLVGVLLMFSSLSGGGQSSVVAEPVPTADIEKALAAAQSYPLEQETPTFEGFDDPRVAEGMDPSLTWNKSDVAVEGEISIRAASPKKVLLVTRSQGQVYCVAASVTGTVSKGKTDATKSAECVGSW